jgi:hypothetical protein
MARIYRMKTSKPLKRPFLMGLLCLAFAGLAAFGWIRVEQAVQYWSLEADLLGPAYPIYSAASGAAWGAAGMAALAALWLRLNWAAPAAWTAALFCAITFWLEKVFVLQSPTRLTNWPFDAGVTAAWLLLVALALHLKRSREYLKRK